MLAFMAYAFLHHGVADILVTNGEWFVVCQCPARTIDFKFRDVKQ